MFARLKAWLFGSSREPAHTASVKLENCVTRWPNLWLLLTGEIPYTPAQRQAGDAWTRAKAAEERGDDRSLGRARMELVEAQCQRLRLGQ